jgi:hypothetical protein
VNCIKSMKTRFSAQSRDPYVVAHAENIAAQFWSEDENVRAKLLVKGATSQLVLHCVPVLIENRKKELFEACGRVRKKSGDIKEALDNAKGSGYILELNLICLNYFVRRGGYGREWQGDGVDFFDPDQFNCSPEICAAIESEAPYLKWLLKCLERAAAGRDILLSDVIRGYLKKVPEDQDKDRHDLWINVSEVFPCWFTYQMNVRDWRELIQNNRRKDVLAVLRRLNRSSYILDSDGLMEQWSCSGILEVHRRMANRGERNISIRAFQNAIFIDAFFRGISWEESEEVDKLEERLYQYSHRVKGDSWRVPESPVSVRLDRECLQSFLLKVPIPDRKFIRLFIAAAGCGARIALCEKVDWPKAILNPDLAEDIPLLKKDPLGWLIGEYGGFNSWMEVWIHLVNNKVIGGNWSDLWANTELMLLLDYDWEDRDSPFIADKSWHLDGWGKRAERRPVSELIG